MHVRHDCHCLLRLIPWFVLGKLVQTEALRRRFEAGGKRVLVMYVCMHICTYICNKFVCMFTCMYVCMYPCTMYACMYVFFISDDAKILTSRTVVFKIIHTIVDSSYISSFCQNQNTLRSSFMAYD